MLRPSVRYIFEYIDDQVLLQERNDARAELAVTQRQLASHKAQIEELQEELKKTKTQRDGMKYLLEQRPHKRARDELDQESIGYYDWEKHGQQKKKKSRHA